MVTIINFKERNKEDGTSFYVLELQGGIELVQSQKTRQFYATAKKAYISSTFDQLTCQALIGTQIPGSIEKEECEPYEYTVHETGEIIILSHRYQYVQKPTEKAKPTNEKFISDVNIFSQKGKSEMIYA